MEITVEEAAEVLRVDYRSIGRWYNEDANVYIPKHAVLDTEDFCRVVGMDHKTFVAFLTGYDMALTRTETAAILGITHWKIRAPKRPAVLSTHRAARWSFRAAAREIAKRMEAKNEKPKLAPGCDLLPLAKDIPGFDECEAVK
jgi:hypothetical protein